jgi:hypothetical protein
MSEVGSPNVVAPLVEAENESMSEDEGEVLNPPVVIDHEID